MAVNHRKDSIQLIRDTEGVDNKNRVRILQPGVSPPAAETDVTRQALYMDLKEAPASGEPYEYEFADCKGRKFVPQLSGDTNHLEGKTTEEIRTAFADGRPVFAGSGTTVNVNAEGDRIETVTVNGYTQQAGSGDPSPSNVRPITVAGRKMVEVVFDGSNDEGWNIATWSANASGTKGLYLYFQGAKASSDESSVECPAFCSGAKSYNLTTVSGASAHDYSCAVLYSAGQQKNGFYVRYKGVNDVATLRGILQKNPLTVWYEPADESQATGIYVPYITEGKEYACQCVKVNDYLCDGDTLQSNVPSGCDKVVTLSGLSWYKLGSGANTFSALISDVTQNQAYSDEYPFLATVGTAQNCISVNSAGVFVTDLSCASVEDLQSKLAQSGAQLWYRSTNYTPDKDLPVCLETHKSHLFVVDGNSGWVWETIRTSYRGRLDVKELNLAVDDKNTLCSIAKAGYTGDDGNVQIATSGYLLLNVSGYNNESDFSDFKTLLNENPATVVATLATPAVYAHDPINITATPYTASTASNSVMILPESPDSPVTLPEGGAADDVPTTLDEPAMADTPTTLEQPVPMAAGNHGTFDVTSDGTSAVDVYLKAMQDGGNASKLGGKLPEEYAAVENAIGVYTHAKSGTVHTLTGSGDNIRFVATADFAAGDTIKVNGTACTATTASGDSLWAGFFKSGAVVVCWRTGNALTFNGGGLPAAELAKLTPEVLKTGVQITANGKTVTGTFTADATAGSGDMLEGKTGYVKGQKVTGTIPRYNGPIEIYPLGSELGIQTIKGPTYIEIGVYGGSDPQYIPENIASGKSIFGVKGTFTDDANAVATQLSQDVVAYVKGQKVVGTLPERGQYQYSGAVGSGEGYIAFNNIPEGIYRKNGASWAPEIRAPMENVASALGLRSDLLKTGVTICSVRGSFTSDANAGAGQILKGYTAYVNGNKVTGTFVTNSCLGGAWSQSGLFDYSPDLFTESWGTLTARYNMNIRLKTSVICGFYHDTTANGSIYFSVNGGGRCYSSVNVNNQTQSASNEETFDISAGTTITLVKSSDADWKGACGGGGSVFVNYVW